MSSEIVSCSVVSFKPLIPTSIFSIISDFLSPGVSWHQESFTPLLRLRFPVNRLVGKHRVVFDYLPAAS